METRVCTWCGDTVPVREFCPKCLEAFPNRRHPLEMTGAERESELRGIKTVEIPFPMIHQRVEALVGRSVWTHEMTSSNFENLCKEAAGDKYPATMQEIIELVPEEKRIVVFVEGEAQP